MATSAQVQEQIEKLQAKLNQLQEKEKGGVVKRLRQAIEAYGIEPGELYPGETAVKRKASAKKASSKAPSFTPDEAPDKKRVLGPSKFKGVKYPAKYKDSQGNTWTGRGPTPRWLKAEVEQGKAREDFLIKGKGQ